MGSYVNNNNINNITNDAIHNTNIKNSKISIGDSYKIVNEIFNNNDFLKKNSIEKSSSDINIITTYTNKDMYPKNDNSLDNKIEENNNTEIFPSNKSTTYIINKNLKISNNSNLNNSLNNSDTGIIKDQLRGSLETKNLSQSITKVEKYETYLNFKEKYIPLIDGEKVGCWQYSNNTFCLFESNNNETFLVYSIENSNERKIKIYALNIFNNETKILYEEFEDKIDNIINKKRRPTQCKYYKINNDEYIIVGFEDSSIYIWVLKNSEFQKIKVIENNGEPINSICLFKSKKNNELTIIFSEYKKSKFKLMNLNEEEKNNINIEKIIYFFDILEKDNKLYILAGLLNKVISFELEEKPTKYKFYKNDKNCNKNSYEKGHECIINYRSNENKNDIKIIDSDTEGRCINIFNFESTELLLILDLINCKPLGINIWNEKYIIVSCLEFIENIDDKNSIKIIKIDLNKSSYSQKHIDLLKNEGAEEKIVANLKGHKNGTISTHKIKNQTGEFFVSIGKDQCLKLWRNYAENVSDFPTNIS